MNIRSKLITHLITHSQEAGMDDNVVFMFGPTRSSKTTTGVNKILLLALEERTDAKIVILTPTIQQIQVVLERLYNLQKQNLLSNITRLGNWVTLMVDTQSIKIQLIIRPNEMTQMYDYALVDNIEYVKDWKNAIVFFITKGIPFYITGDSIMSQFNRPAGGKA